MAEADDRNGMLVAYLREREEACPGCGYNLRALTGTRCPECNQELVLRVGLAEPRLAWFVAGLVGIGMGLGFSLLLLLYAIQRSVFGRGGRMQTEFLAPVALGTLVGAIVLMVWIRSRRRLSGASSASRWGCAIVAVVIGLVCPVWFMFAVR